MSPSAIVQKLWNYCNVMPASLSSAHVNLPACRALLGPPAWLRAGAGRRDDLSAWDLPALQQAGGMSYVEQLTYLLFLKMADEGAAGSVSFQC